MIDLLGNTRELLDAAVSAIDTVQNRNAMQNSDKQNARIECDAALQKAMLNLVADHTELFKQFSDNPEFRKWLADNIFNVTYQAPAG